MKVVLMHDWLTGQRGGEHVLEALCEMFPDAPLYTLLHKKGSVNPLIEKRKITTSFLDKIPGIHEHYRKFLPLFPKAADSLKIKEQADLVISTSHCVIKGVKKPAGSKHLSYIHSPMRYLYDQYDAYFGPTAPVTQQLGARIFRNYLTKYDQESNKNVDLMVANSQFVKERISKYYGLDSVVVNPFVNHSEFGGTHLRDLQKQDYFVMVTAFAPNKKVDLAIKAFNDLGWPLRIVGGGQLDRYLRAMAKPNIKFFGNMERKHLLPVLVQAKALIFPGVEDFGIVPLEALAAGTPVIAYKAGGVLETLDDKTADFFTAQTVASLEEALDKFDPNRFVKENLLARAAHFSKERFKSQIQEQINKLVAQ